MHHTIFTWKDPAQGFLLLDMLVDVGYILLYEFFVAFGHLPITT